MTQRKRPGWWPSVIDSGFNLHESPTEFFDAKREHGYGYFSELLNVGDFLFVKWRDVNATHG